MKHLLVFVWVAVVCVVGVGVPARAQDAPKLRPPIIDMHLHAETLSGFLGETPDSELTLPEVCAGSQQIVFPGWDPREPLRLGEVKSCQSRVAAPATDEELLRQTLEMLDRYNILAVTSGPLEEVTRWRAAAPDRIIPAVNFERGHDGQGGALYREPEELRRLFSEGKFAVFAEVGPQYHGLSPADDSLEPYFALAEELDIPIGLHLGEGPPGGPNQEGYSQYRVRLGSPLLLEDVLIRHPKLRIYVMHYGSPLVDEMIAVLYSYPQVYVDVALNNWGFPRKHFHGQLRRLVEAGFGKRILFGSDQMIWPQTIPLAIEAIETADFLTEEQKRDIFCRNAARFLRLNSKTCE